MTCKNCGSEVVAGNKFCAKCGTAQVVEAPAAQVADASAPVPTVEASPTPAAPVEPTPVAPVATVAPVEPTTPAQTGSPAVETVPVQQQPVQPASPQQPVQPTQPYQQQQPAHPYQQQQPAHPYQQGQAYQQQPVQPAQPYQSQQYQYGQPYQQTPPPDGPKKQIKWKIIAPIAATVAIIAVAAIILVMFLNSPMRIAYNAISNFGDEISERVDGTPLELFGMLLESMEDGSVTVEFDYQDNSDWMFTGPDISGAITLHADYESRQYAAEASMLIDGFELDFDFHFNNESMAFRIPQIDNNFYGIIFETFADDFREFANIVGLSQREIAEAIEMIEAYERWMNMQADMDGIYEKYEELFADFLDDVDVSISRVNYVHGRSVSARRIDFVATAEMFVNFMEDYINMLDDDEDMRALFAQSDAFMEIMDPFGSSGSVFDEMIRDLRSMMRELDGLEGYMTFSMYVGSGNRLLRMELDMNFGFDEELERVVVALDLGESASDAWRLSADAPDGSEFILDWEVNDTSNGGETIVRAIMNDRRSSFEYEVILDWSDRGDFTLSFYEGWHAETVLTGNYTSNAYGFELWLYDLIDSDWDWSDESLDIGISTARRTESLEPVDFINISDWGQRVVDMMDDFADDLFDQMFGFPDVDDWDFDLPDIELPVIDPDPDPDPADDDDDFVLPWDTGRDLSDSELLGWWDVYGGDNILFFEDPLFVVFDELGLASAGLNFGMFYEDGNNLTIIANFGMGDTYEFTFEFVGDLLAITDSTGATMYLEFMWS